MKNKIITYLNGNEWGRGDPDESSNPEGLEVHPDHGGHNVNEPVGKEGSNPAEKRDKPE